MPSKPQTYKPSGARPAPRVEDRRTSAQRGYGYAWQRLRLTILARDHYLCQECQRQGKITPVGKSGHVDHVIPKERGGTDDPDNLETKCSSCHSRKTAAEDGGFGNRGRDHR